ncbi:MAG: DUF533 domain-containing protein, partial [Candidatus Rokubacteria bacterium]|nr:DUF533 domain-containing protein [Candidatus Rokubacteria bacterium]
MASNASMLEQMLEAALRGGGLRQGEAAAPRRERAGGESRGGSDPLGDLLGSVLGGPRPQSGEAGTGRPAPGGSGGLGEILDSILRGPAAAGDGARDRAAPQGSGGDGPARSPQAQAPQGTGMSDLIRYGGIAVIGMLAYQALKRYQAQQAAGAKEKAAQAEGASALVPPSDSGFHPASAPGGPDALSGVLLDAMVAATQADGVIDEEEQRRLAGRLDELGLSPADRQALASRLTTPVDPREIVR